MALENLSRKLDKDTMQRKTAEYLVKEYGPLTSQEMVEKFNQENVDDESEILNDTESWNEACWTSMRLVEDASGRWHLTMENEK